VLCTQLPDDNNLTNVYLAYTAEGAEQAMRPQTAKSGRPKTANKSRNARRSALAHILSLHLYFTSYSLSLVDKWYIFAEPGHACVCFFS